MWGAKESNRALTVVIYLSLHVHVQVTDAMSSSLCYRFRYPMNSATMGVAIECVPADKENIDPATGELSPRLTSRMLKKRVALQDITLMVLPKKVF